MANPLRDIVPSNVRKIYYSTVGAAVVVCGAIQAGLEAGDVSTPQWLKIVKGSLFYLAGGGTILAASNITPTDPPAGGDTPGEDAVPTPPEGNDT